ncbi:crotonase/enoyl-CoA hydratase family protein [Aeromicrobium sp. CFBP 8757]|nr:crotonase/enoyl-CoA hydratase family protein [Aeromicrobium sp. CFBP 8757]
MPPKVLTEQRGHVLVITMNRPEVMNCSDDETADLLCAALDLLDEQDDLFVGVLTGAGGNFSTGGDLKAIRASDGVIKGTPRGDFGIFQRPPDKPLIAAVEGFAVAGGLEACLCCDLIVASSAAQFAVPEVRHNLVAQGGALFRLPTRIPYHLAMEMVLTGEPQGAEAMHRHGLVNRVVEPGQALAEAVHWAEQLLVNGPTALAATKQIVTRARDWTQAEAFVHQKELARQAIDSADRHEGLAAFAEKRTPQWKGR